MTKLKVLFFDVGGVCLTNGWDEKARHRAAIHFCLPSVEMEKRHKPLFKTFEQGEISLNNYLAEVIFYKKRSFSKDEFIRFMENESKAHETTFKILRQLKRKNSYLLATLNNESMELNRFRIEKFGLRDYFTLFFSSCFLGVRKPEASIFEKALQVTQTEPEKCLFIDDRVENAKAARMLGFQTIHLKNVERLSSELMAYGIEGAQEPAGRVYTLRKEIKI